MNALKGLNKEQWTAAAAVALSALFVLTGAMGGGVKVKDGAPASSARGYEPVRHRSVDFGHDTDLSKVGKPMFPPETTSRLSAPPIRPPEPREEEVPAPFLRPGPSTAAYNALTLKVKYPGLSATSPVLPAAEMPAPAEIEALKKLEEPVQEPRKDRRGDRQHEFFSVKVKNSTIVYEGELLGEPPLPQPHFRIRLKGEKGQVNIDKAKCDLDSVLYADTYADQYKKKSLKIPAGAKEAAERTALAKWALDLGMLPEAKRELGLALKAKKDLLEAVLLLGQIHVEQADHDGAVAVYEAGIADGVPPAEMLFEIGRCLRAVGFLEGAQGAFEKAIEARPGHNASRLALARVHLDLGNVAAAAGQAGDVLGRFSGAGVTDAQRAEAALVQGLAALRLGDLAKARKLLEGAAPEAVNALGVVDLLEGNARAAASAFARAIAANQYLTEAWHNLGTALLLAGRWAEAEAMFAAAVQRDPVAADALAGLACAQVMAANAAASQALARALALDPRHAHANAVAGLLKMREGATTEAADRYAAALRADFDYLPAYSGAAAAYLRAARALSESRDEKGARELRIRAETLLAEVAARDAGRPSARLALGCAYAVMGRAGDAAAEFGMAASAYAGKPADPLLGYAQGYVEALHGPNPNLQVRLAAARAIFAQTEAVTGITDPAWLRTIEECRRAKEAIDDWMLTEVRLEEDFERPALGSEWQKIDGVNGVAIELAGGRVRFAGKQAVNSLGVTALQRDIPSPNFHSLEVTFYLEKTEKTEFGVSILTSATAEVKTGLHFGRDMHGKFRQATLAEKNLEGRDMSLSWVDTKVAPPDANEIRLKVVKGERKGTGASTFTILVYDAAKGDWVTVVPSLAPGGAQTDPMWRISFWARAPMGQEYAFSVDNVKVLERGKP